jgi:hypothetical protein
MLGRMMIMMTLQIPPCHGWPHSTECEVTILSLTDRRGKVRLECQYTSINTKKHEMKKHVIIKYY